jgi:polyisoprenoid-binding protein YceI
MSPPGQTPATAVTPSAPTATVAPVAGADTLPEGGSAGVTITLGQDSVARYLVREQLAGLSLPNDAVGETSGVAGIIVVDGNGRVDSARSTLTVDLASLQSDEGRRDNFLRTRSLQSDTFPTARFEARQTHGLPWPLPTQGEHSFQIEGDMTVREVTRPLTWEVTARFEEESVLGRARTSFTFDEFQITQPSVSIVLSVDDEIRLELDFTGRLAREFGP